MKLKTIWFGLPGATLKERLARTRDSLAMKAAWKLPRPVLYWAAVRAAVVAEPNENPSEVTVTQMMEALSGDA